MSFARVSFAYGESLSSIYGVHGALRQLSLLIVCSMGSTHQCPRRRRGVLDNRVGGHGRRGGSRLACTRSQHWARIA